MTAPEDLRSKRVTVAGLGRFGGGIAVTKWLVSQGAQVVVTDEAAAPTLEPSVRQLDGLPVTFHLGGFTASDFQTADLIVASPAIPPTSPAMQMAGSAGVPVTTEIRLFIERCPSPIVGVTGTKGKSTTTALLGGMLQAKYRTWVGGNLGGSLLADLDKIRSDDRVVLELSSYMLEHLGAAAWSPSVAVVTMLAADHLSWHGSLEAYLNSKRNIVRFQKPGDVAVLGGACRVAETFASLTPAKVLRYPPDPPRPLKLTLPGSHNQLNAQAAAVAAAAMGVDFDAAQAAVRAFAGLPHRLEMVHESGGVRWVNDSIATIPQAAIAALEAFAPGTVLQIVGGSDKHLPIDDMATALATTAKAVLCIGETGSAVAERVRGVAGRAAEVIDCVTLPAAVAEAAARAVEGDVVLLSTGFASYDQFTNFEERGNAFAALARTNVA